MYLKLPFDDILDKYIGPLGAWQWLTFWIIIFPMMTPSIYFPAFGIYVPRHRCRLPQFQNLSFSNINENLIPLKSSIEDPPMIGQIYHPCLMYSNMSFYNNFHYESSNNTILQTKPCANGFEYDPERAFKRSVVEEFDLVCDRAYLAPLSTLVYIIGSVIGCCTIGSISDRIGRRPVILTSAYVLFLSCVLISFSPNFFIYASVRFIIGFVEFSNHVTIFLYLMEITTAKYRNIFAALNELFIAVLAYSSVPLFAYMFQSWRWLHIGISVFCLPCITFYWLVPESPRWLLANGREKEAFKIIRLMIQRNNPSKSDDEIESLINKLTIEEEIYRSQSTVNIAENPAAISDYRAFKKLQKLVLIFRHPVLRKRLLIFSTWLDIGMLYYGVAYYSPSLDGNEFLLFFIMGLMGIPGGIMAFLLYYKFNRNKPLFVIQILTVPAVLFGSVIQIFFNNFPSIIPLAVTLAITKVLINAAFVMIYIYTAELFPTETRNIGLALCAAMGRLGAGISPFIIQFGVNTWRPLPLIIFAVVTFIGSICVLLQPETKNLPMIDRVKNIDISKTNTKNKNKPGSTELEQNNKNEIEILDVNKN